MNINQALKAQKKGKILALSDGLPAELKKVNGQWILDSQKFGYGASEALEDTAKDIELFKVEQQSKEG